MIPIARAVLGEVGATPTKTQQVDMALAMGLPRIQDDEETGNNQIFNYKKTIIRQLQNLRDNRFGNYDTSKIDGAIAKYNSDFLSPTTQSWNPIQTSKGVISGTSQVANATMDNVNKGATAGLNVATAGVAPPTNAAPQATTPYPITGTPGPTPYPVTPPGETPGAVKTLVNAPGAIKNLLTPRPGGPGQDQDLTSPATIPYGSY